MAGGEGVGALSGTARFRIAIAAILAAHLAVLAVLAHVTPWTTDEGSYLAAGMALRQELRFDAFSTILHGPLPFYSNQLCFPEGVAATPEAVIAHKLDARLGMLPLAALAAIGTALLARTWFGRRAALGALVLHTTNPIVLGHGCLITADMALTAAWVWLALAAVFYLRAPGAGRAALVGVALGTALATKYLALFALPALAITFAGSALFGANATTPIAHRLRTLLLSAAVCATVALGTLHACYGFRAGGYALRPPAPGAQHAPQDPDAGALSSTFRGLVETPGAAAALSLLPAPWVRGVDYQKFYSEAGGTSTLGERVGPGFASYFAVALGSKLPLVMLALLAAGLALRRPRWPPHAGLLLACMIGVPAVYLSIGTALQIGVRYLLPILPLLAILGGRAIARWSAAPAGRWGLAVAAVVLLAEVGTSWPRYVGAFNPLFRAQPYLLFADSNLDWRSSWEPDHDDRTLAQRYPQSAALPPTGGPRFGTIRARGLDLSRPDPRDPSRVHHWLRRFAPIDRLGANYVFAVDDAAFAAAIDLGGPDEDARGVLELAIARLGAGDVEGAEALLHTCTDPDTAIVARLAQDLAAAPPLPGRALHTWLSLGRADLVLAAPAAPEGLRAHAHLARGEPDRAAALLRAVEEQRPLTIDEVMLLASSLAPSAPEQASAVLTRHRPPDGSPLRAAYDALERQLRDATQAVRLLQRDAGGADPR